MLVFPGLLLLVVFLHFPSSGITTTFWSTCLGSIMYASVRCLTVELFSCDFISVCHWNDGNSLIHKF